MMNPEQLRRELQHGEGDDLRRRRAIIGVSLVGMASMVTVSLLQTGILRHLPDPPLNGFNSDKVNSSDVAYQFGAPDGTLGHWSQVKDRVELSSTTVHSALIAVSACVSGCRAAWPSQRDTRLDRRRRRAERLG